MRCLGAPIWVCPAHHCRPAAQDDQLLSWVSSYLTSSVTAQAASSSASLPLPGSPVPHLSEELKVWEVRFADLRINGPIGRGSFGKVGLAAARALGCRQAGAGEPADVAGCTW